MAVRLRRAKRRRNSVRGVGTLVLNPRRNGRRRSRARRRNTLVLSNGRRNKRRHNRRRRNTLVLSNGRRRNKRRSRRRNTLVLSNGRRNRRRRHNRRHALKNRRRNGRRKAPRVVYRFKNRRRRRNGRRFAMARRHNPMGFLSKIPVIGPLLAGVMSFAGPAVFGAIGVEPTMLAAKFIGPYVPGFNSSLFYAASGLLLAGAVKMLGLPYAKELAIGLASGGGAVAYYKWRTGTDGDMAGELGMLPDYGDGAYAVVPFGEASGSSELGAFFAQDYAGVTLGDAFASPADLSDAELGVARLGPKAWATRFPRARYFRREAVPPVPPYAPAPSPEAGVEGRRWGWALQLMGPERFFGWFTNLPPARRQRVIADLRNRVEQLAASAPQGDGNMGTLIPGRAAA